MTRQADILRERIYRASDLDDRELAELGDLVRGYLELHPEDLALADEASILAREASGRRYQPRSLRDGEREVDLP